MAITLPQIYGDERDAIIAKWNQLQAYWGTGKGYFSQNGVVNFTPENPYCKFKVIIGILRVFPRKFYKH